MDFGQAFRNVHFSLSHHKAQFSFIFACQSFYDSRVCPQNLYCYAFLMRVLFLFLVVFFVCIFVGDSRK